MTSLDGTVERLGSEYALRFERHFAHSIEKVWAALTTPERMAEWLGRGPGYEGAGHADIELRPGGRVKVGDQTAPYAINGEILALEPPRLLEFTWDSATQGWKGGVVRWELTPEAGGTMLQFQQTVPGPALEAARSQTLAGWHLFLDLLTSALEGNPETWGWPKWQAHNEHYAAEA